MLKSWKFPDERGRCLILFMRHMGDTVITCGFVNSLRRRYPEMRVDILGRPDLREVCAAFSSFDEYIGVDFPVYGHHRRGLSDVKHALQAMLAVRRKHYTYCVNLVGDVRENLIGWMTGAQWKISPAWSQGHMFARKITPGMSWISNCGIEIPVEYRNYYDSLEYLAARLGLGKPEWHRRTARKRARAEPPIVALHPGASHPSKRWETDKWKTLIRDLKTRGFRMTLLGSPAERGDLFAAFDQEIRDGAVEVRTSDLAGMLEAVGEADLLVGMDSFSVHVAYAAGVPVVILHGSSDPGVINPPGGIELSAGNLCDVFPCHYKYPCKNSEGEYRCVRGIKTGEVVNAVGTLTGMEN